MIHFASKTFLVNFSALKRFYFVIIQEVFILLQEHISPNVRRKIEKYDRLCLPRNLPTCIILESYKKSAKKRINATLHSLGRQGKKPSYDPAVKLNPHDRGSSYYQTSNIEPLSRLHLSRQRSHCCQVVKSTRRMRLYLDPYRGGSSGLSQGIEMISF